MPQGRHRIGVVGNIRVDLSDVKISVCLRAWPIWFSWHVEHGHHHLPVATTAIATTTATRTSVSALTATRTSVSALTATLAAIPTAIAPTAATAPRLDWNNDAASVLRVSYLPGPGAIFSLDNHL